MKHIELKFVFYILLLLLSSCNKGNRSKIEKAMYYAGENATELKKVLKHYSSDEKDSLKLKAAEFLIVNMPGHVSYKNPAYVESYYDEIEKSVSLDNSNEENKNIIVQISKFHGINLVYGYSICKWF